MDKARDVKRRGASRFKHSKPELSSGLVTGVPEDFVGFSEKSRREKKLRKLSSVVGEQSSSIHVDSEMDSLGRDEDELRSVGGDGPNSSIRFKASDKVFDDCNGVGHASVPRRLRSAMKKRSCDSISPRLSDSKKLKNHTSGGTNSTKTDVVKKPKSNMKQVGSDRSSRRIMSGPITKDEEEVAETLYALAGMFPNIDTNDDFKGKCESLEPNPSDVPESNDSHRQEVKERNESSVSPLMAAEAAGPSSSAEILPETVEVESLDELNLSHSNKLHLPPHDSIPPINKKTSSSSAKIETQPESKPTFSPVKFSVPPEPHLDAGLKQAQQNEAPFLERKPRTTLDLVTPTASQLEPPSKVDESNKTGLELSSGLPSTSVPSDAGVDDSRLPSSASKLPAWLDVAFSNSRSSSVQYNSLAKESKVTADKKVSKRCATHVYISRLIQSLSRSPNKATTMTTMQRPYQGSNQGVSPVKNNFHGAVNGANGIPSSSSLESSVAKQSPNGAKNAVSNWRKQSYDFFMSIAAGGGGGGIEVHNGSARARNGSDPLSHLQNPYLPSFPQHQFGPPYTQPCYNSSDQFSPPQQLPFYAAQGRHHHQQRQLWGSPHYRGDESPKMTIQFLNLQNAAAPLQQQQRPMGVVPPQFSPGKVGRQEQHFPLVYEDHGGAGGFRTTALPLQLLCNERL